ELADQVDPVEQWGAQPSRVAKEVDRRTGAFGRRTCARTAVARGDQHGGGGEDDRALTTRDLHHALFERLPKSLERRPRELRKLVRSEERRVGKGRQSE